ncbi:MAG: aspartate aminotransferase [Proteobacteria bacterium]|nr:aspartate aminotransferase [Pseudomonadota bacterium]
MEKEVTLKLSKRALSIQESAIRKLSSLVAQQQDVSFYHLNIGQPDLSTPEPILKAIQAWSPKVISYGPASGTRACREAFAKYHGRWQKNLSWADVAVTTGGSEALLFAFTAICDPGDEILVPTPFYTNYNGFATVAGASIRPIPTSIKHNFTLPSNEALDKYTSDKTKAFVFSNPGNPTGAIYDQKEIDRIADWCERNGLFLISDEVYRRIWFDNPPGTALCSPNKDAVIVIDSLSKTWSACGLRLGALISRNQDLMGRIERLGQARLGVQPLAQHAGIAALNMPESYYEEIRGIWKERVDCLYDSLNKIPNIKHNKPSGAFYTMVELPVDSAEHFARHLVTNFRSQGESLVIAPGGGFYVDNKRGKAQIRLAAVLEPQKIKRSAEILGEALSSYQTD